VWLASFSQLVYHAEEFVRQMLDRGQEIDVDAFPTLKAMTYTVFHKFYADGNRKPSYSDAFDVLSHPGFDGDFVARVRLAEGEVCHAEVEEVPGGVVGACYAVGVRVGPAGRACRC
jgi:hypothetical protein